MLNKIEQAIKELKSSKEKVNVEALINEAWSKAQQQLSYEICDLVAYYIDQKLRRFEKSLDKKVKDLKRKETIAEVTNELSLDNLGLENYNRILKLIDNMSDDEIAYQDEFKEALVVIMFVCL